jgi:hypothetical protein
VTKIDILSEAAKVALQKTCGDPVRAVLLFKRRVQREIARTKLIPITQERIKERLSYDPLTGHFHWLQARRDRIGKRAGGPMLNKYWHIRVDDVDYYAHHLAWLYMTGEMPALYVDHRNGDGMDNSWYNLREVSQSLNMANARSQTNKKTGLPRGVKYRPSGRLRYRAAIKRAGRTIYIGSYKTADEAATAYETKSRELFGEYSYAHIAN